MTDQKCEKNEYLLQFGEAPEVFAITSLDFNFSIFFSELFKIGPRGGRILASFQRELGVPDHLNDRCEGEKDYSEGWLVLHDPACALQARRIIDLMEEYFSRLWIYCRHLVLIMQCFVQYGFIKQTKYFGTYRVELAVSCSSF